LPDLVDQRYSYEGETFLLMMSRVKLGNPVTLTLYVVAVVPENDYFSEIIRGRSVIVPVVIVASMISLLRHVPWAFLLALLREKCNCSSKK